MLNKDNERELAYVIRIGWIKPIAGADNIELVGINGWQCIAKKGEFAENDLAVYFEIDSKLPEDAEWAAFLAPKHFKVKTMKLGKFNVVSQGLALPASAFGAICYQDGDGQMYIHFDKNSYIGKNVNVAEGEFLTKELGVTYSVEEDNARKAKANPDAKINAALARHPQIAKKYGKFIKKHKFARWLFLLFFGKKKDVRDWPIWVAKTDEERIQNIPFILNNKEPWIATEKIDGTSTTFTMKRGKLGKYEFYICSRNVVFNKPDKKCFYNTNVYIEMAEKYNIENVLKDILDKNKDLDWVTLQGETFGEGIQKRDYGMKNHDFRGFNFITSKEGRWDSIRAAKYLQDEYNIPWVPIIDTNFILPDTVEELLAIATDKSKIDGGMREGLVFRSQDGTQSFKAVSNEFLLKYHQ